jgi:ABC-type transporter Mla subunit MlaD
MTRLGVPGPRELLRLTTDGYQALEQAIGLLPRVVGLVGEIERIVRRADAVVTEVERTQQQADAVIEQSGALIDRTGTVLDGANNLLTGYQPALDRLAPLVDQLARTTSPAEVAAAIQLIDELPKLVEALQRDILPILATLDNVGPDVRELLETTKEFNEILGSVPGLGRIKKRVEEERAEEERAEQLDGERE